MARGQRFVDPLPTGYLDLQEMANAYQQVSLRKVRLYHSIVTHHLPLFFPEAEQYLHASRAAWFPEVLRLTPCPAAVRRYSKAAFIAAALAKVGGHKADKRRWLADFYDTAQLSAGVPVAEDSDAMRLFRIVLEELQLHRCRVAIDSLAKIPGSDVTAALRALANRDAFAAPDRNGTLRFLVREAAVNALADRQWPASGSSR